LTDVELERYWTTVGTIYSATMPAPCARGAGCASVRRKHPRGIGL